MPRWLHEDDRLVDVAIDRWYYDANDQIDDIGAWRDNTDKQNQFTGDPRREWQAMPDGFCGDTLFLFSQITARHPHLDPNPLMEVYEATRIWHDDHNASRLPAQSELDATLGRAMMVLNAARADIATRIVYEDGRHLMKELLSETKPPTLFTTELERLRKYLDKPIDPTKHEQTERENRDKLTEILKYNDELRDRAASGNVSPFNIEVVPVGAEVFAQEEGRADADQQEVGGAPYEFRKQGEKWVLTYKDQTVYMDHSVGLLYLSMLIADAGRGGIPATGLVAAATWLDERILSGSSGETWDKEYIKQVGEEREDLREKIEQARENHDPALQERLEDELGKLEAEVSRALGLGGTPREQSDTEKARKSVAMAILRAIDAIEKQNLKLAQHLRRFTKTGQVCYYDPESPIDWIV